MSSATTERPRGTAVVTGAAAGLGQAFALGLARAGHDLAILDVADAADTVSSARSMGVDVVAVQGDASDAADLRRFADQVRSALAPVRVLVNNVGISPYAPFADTTLDVWHRVLTVNLDSLFLATQEFLPDLRRHGSGRIVNITSTVVWDAQVRDMTAYATSKAAVVGFTRALAGEVGADGVTVNAIAPGIVLTPDIAGRVADDKLEAYRMRQAVPRLAEAADLVPALLYVVDESAGQVTGTVLPVNGGRVVL